jgi:L-ribulose-5-phosphate 4-epimerase
LSETGTVKFVAERSKSHLDSFDRLEELNLYRARIRDLGLLGVDENGIGFGNISLRDQTTSAFYITGSNTAHKTQLVLKDCARVTRCFLAKNCLLYEGETLPSSESLTHAAIYETRPLVGAIIHGHDAKLWSFLLREGLATPADAEYGTPEMAEAVKELFRIEFPSGGPGNAFAMSGHHGGVIIFGRNLSAAYDALLVALRKSS